MIPKVIHYCWFGGNDLPDLAQKCIESWHKYCPDYTIIQWNEKNYDIKRNKYMEGAYIAKKWGFVPDFARLDIVYENGGFYFDTDVELIRPLDELLEYKAFCGMESAGRVAFGLGFGAEPQNEMIKLIRSIYESKLFVNDYEYLSTHTDPQYTTELLKTIGLEEKDVEQTIRDLKIFPTQYFCPKDVTTGIERITEKTISIHHYDGSWAPNSIRDYNSYKWKVFKKYGKVFGTIPWAMYVIRKFGYIELINKIKKHI